MTAGHRLHQRIALVVTGVFVAISAASTSASRPYPSTLGGGAPCGSCDEPQNLSSSTVIASPNEPGERMEISGTIYQSDGRTPASGIVLFVFHTNAAGYYNDQDDASHPRLRGWMKTGADGRYRFETIKPGPYPHRATPAHVHAHIYSSNISEHSIGDFWFAGDPFITDEVKQRAGTTGKPPAIVTLTRGANGTLYGARDIRLTPSEQ